MLLSRNEGISWGISILIVAAMGLLVAHGPFHNVNKPAKVLVTSLAPKKVTIVTDPKVTALYVPSPLTVHVGQKITWVNESNAPHTVTSDPNQPGPAFDSGNVNTGGGSWTFQPTKPGTYKYYCQYHQLMHGVLIVVK